MALIKRVLIDLDCLLDTRLGLINHLNPEVASRIAKQEHYWSRDFTDWELLTEGEITNEQFNTAWKERGNDVIKQSMMTSIFLPLESTLATHRINKEEGLSDFDVALVINEWPYTLSDDVHDAIKEAVRFHLSGNPLVIFTRTSLDELTPQHMVDNYHQVYMFDFLPWIKRHGFALEKIHAPDLTVVVPRLFDQDPHDLDTEQKKKDIFFFQMITRYYFELQFIEVEYFSMFRPDVLNRLNETIRVYEESRDDSITPSP